jgi:hypothetical protein
VVPKLVLVKVSKTILMETLMPLCMYLPEGRIIAANACTTFDTVESKHENYGSSKVVPKLVLVKVLKTILIEPPLMPLCIYLPEGRIIAANASRFDTVESVMVKIRNIEGIAVNCQRLFYAGGALESTCILSKFDIKADSVLYLRDSTCRLTLEPNQRQLHQQWPKKKRIKKLLAMAHERETKYPKKSEAAKKRRRENGKFETTKTRERNQSLVRTNNELELANSASQAFSIKSEEHDANVAATTTTPNEMSSPISKLVFKSLLFQHIGARAMEGSPSEDVLPGHTMRHIWDDEGDMQDGTALSKHTGAVLSATDVPDGGMGGNNGC